MELEDGRGKFSGKIRRFPDLKPTICGDYVPGLILLVLGLDEVAAVFYQLYSNDTGIVYYRKLVFLHIRIDAADKLIAGHKAVWIRAVVFTPRELKAPVWRYECERIPALAAPRIPWLAGLIEDNMLAPLLFESVAGR
jgi:hypothetical protein